MRFTIDRNLVRDIPNAMICEFEHVTVLPRKQSEKIYAGDVAALMPRLQSILDAKLPTQEVQGFSDLYSAPSAGLRLVNNILKNQRFPRYSNLIDAYNLVSAETLQPLGAHDITSFQEDTELRLKRASGNEVMVPAFKTEPVTIPQGNVTYGRLDGEIFTPMAWLGEQDVDNSKFQIGKEPERIAITVIGHAATSEEFNFDIAQKIDAYIKKSCPQAKMTLHKPTIV